MIVVGCMSTDNRGKQTLEGQITIETIEHWNVKVVHTNPIDLLMSETLTKLLRTTLSYCIASPWITLKKWNSVLMFFIA